MFKLPVINIGIRQQGRVRSANIIDVGYAQAQIVCGIEQALSDQFRENLEQLINPYGDGHAADCIVRVLKQVELGNQLLIKPFIDHSLDVE